MSLKPPMKNDVLLTYVSSNEAERERLNKNLNGFIIKEKNNTDFEYYKVEQIGEDVTDVSVGDVVMCKWANMMEPFEWDGTKYTVTDQKEIMAVVEYD